MISVDVCQGAQIHCGLPPEQIGQLVRQPGQVIWVDGCAPTQEDWDTLRRQFGFHPLALEDAQKQNQRAKLDAYGDYLFLSARAWAGTDSPTADLADVTQEIDMFLGPNYLVSLHEQGCVPSVEAVRRRWERHPGRLPDEPAFLLYVLLDAIVDDYFPVMDQIDEAIDALETAVYTPGAEVELRAALALKKRLLLLRQAVAPMRDVVNQLLRAEQALIPASVRVYLHDVYDHTLRLVEQVDLHRDIVAGVLDAIMAQASNRLNQVMKRLTTIAALFLPITAITGFFGMNIGHLERAPSWSLWLCVGLMLAASVGVWAFFQRKGWW